MVPRGTAPEREDLGEDAQAFKPERFIDTPAEEEKRRR